MPVVRTEENRLVPGKVGRRKMELKHSALQFLVLEDAIQPMGERRLSPSVHQGPQVPPGSEGGGL